jgi:hypothetical protein
VAECGLEVLERGWLLFVAAAQYVAHSPASHRRRVAADKPSMNAAVLLDVRLQSPSSSQRRSLRLKIAINASANSSPGGERRCRSTSHLDRLRLRRRLN